MKIYYFDNAATTPLDKKVLNEMLPFLTSNYGNPSSMHTLGKYSKQAIEDSRKKISNILNCDSQEIYFTSGGSESDNTAIKCIAHANKDRRKSHNNIFYWASRHIRKL